MKKQSKTMTKAVVVGTLVLTCSLLFMASGCSTRSDEAAAIKVGESLKKMQYEIQVADIGTTVEDRIKKQEEFKPFLTEQGYVAFATNRQSAIASGYAMKNKLNMKVKHIEFENMNQDNMEKDTFSFRYSIDLELSPSELTSSKGTSVVTRTGHMSVVKQDDEWKVLKDLDNGFIADE
ncbi:hypothetical protein [Paenibacillus macquariensis]|uniref:DUF4829 domain-containing protein n=1 Tax=Paenibacillus macquariensis TaxID=948756 RepID=A0ABY1K986_9BACL|nr:hypothetical protein [Paenibacillus macquariensis]MEC0091571.1 hypothetical protein [Paenibacillus macquariensis]OAB26699.1 hypothetical protein PMSM_26410 [Paenibacillus macquariensis subsp. macquariensis]SIR44882.1 hypothetical protein SAMN05421578_11483 [Paenibacillus macquariensis]